ncbi:MAG: hypothetical protein WC870_00660 [Candidatus Paceibacterota bacterium]
MDKDEVKNKMVQTYAEDMAKVLENDTEGLVKKIIHGEEEHEAEKRNLSPESKKNKLFMFISFLLIVFSLAILSFFFFKKDINTVPVEKQFVPLVFNDKITFLEVSGFKKEEIMQTVLSEVNTTKVKNGGVEGIYLTENKQIIGLRRFISIIKSNFVPEANSLLVNDNFLMGVVNSKISETRIMGEGFFILLKVRSTADIFDALRAWEGKMFFDLRGFLGINLSGETNYLLTKDFEDGIIENKNARILRDKDEKIVLMYVFADENSVVITNSQPAVHEIMLRLASASKKQ